MKIPISLSEEDGRIVKNIVAIVIIEMQNYLQINTNKRRKTLADAFNQTVDFPKRQGLAIFPKTIMNKSNTKLMTPGDMLNEFAQDLKKKTKENVTIRKDTFSKILSILEKNDVLQSTTGKPAIKKKFPSLSSPGRPQKGLSDKREGYPIIYSSTTKVDDYKRVLENPKSLEEIKERLSRFDETPSKFYKAAAKDFFWIIVKNGKPELYDFFSRFLPEKKGSEDIMRYDYWERFKKEWSNADNQKKDEWIEEWANYTTENPIPLFFFLFGLNNNQDQ